MEWIHALKNKSKSKKGASVLEFAMGLLIFVLLFAFAVDIIMITTKQHTVSQTANQIARQIAIQGGVKQSAPTGYPGGDKAYMDSKEMVVYLQEEFKDAGIAPTEWKLELEGFSPSGHPVGVRSLTNGTNFEVDYQNLFEFEIEYQYKWNIIGQIIPPMGKMSTSVQKRSAISEFKYTNY